MPRLRRYRVFVACAVVFLFLLYRVSDNSGWDTAFQYQHAVAERKAASGDRMQKPLAVQGSLAEEKVKLPELEPVTEVRDGFALPTPTLVGQLYPAGQNGDALLEPPVPTDPPVVVIPDRKPGKVADAYLHEVDEPLHIQNPPGRAQDSTIFTMTTIHWQKPPEWFPIAEDSLIPLPTGKPKSVPRIQYPFGSESTDAKAAREDRLAQVKAEMKHAWDGYSRFAFGHDELTPISEGYADPFAGWGATLVDALDTLWIMDLKDEFDEAYRGLADIDFTTTPYRKEIPVFETTIRYLGGLLAAYDVTGGHKGDYPLLLKKAVELAEILMGVFDTPNRMPDLFYRWKPAFAFEPKRASTHSGIAELGTLSMEFTRLAQLTGRDKYYDAVARITDALEEWQNREDDTAPAIPGIFPQNVDLSGCNRSATTALKAASAQARKQAALLDLDEPQGYVPATSGGPAAKEVTIEGKPSVESRITPGRALSHETGGFKHIARREVSDEVLPKKIVPHQTDQKSKKTAPHTSGRSAPFQSHNSVGPLDANGLPIDWDCVPKNITASSGVQTYSMGGSQDSAYEYFPKQYLLLGGLEPKYRTMHENAISAVKEWLLYRPMVPGDPDILFSSLIKLQPGQTFDRRSYVFEVAHLSCFLGGMFGLGAKIFESPEDLEIAQRLADGCVWAYSATPSGIMPEYAQVVPCRDINDCHWNETIWTDEYLDPNPGYRVGLMEDYLERLELWEAETQQVIRQEAERLQAAEEIAQRGQDLGETWPNMGQIATEPGVPVGYSGSSGGKAGSSKSGGDIEERSSNSKRGIVDDEAKDPLSLSDEHNVGSTYRPLDPITLDQKAIEEKMRIIESELNLIDETTGRPHFKGSVNRVGQLPIDTASINLPRRPFKPKTHEEVVAERIKSEDLPPGFTQIGDRRYILR